MPRLLSLLFLLASVCTVQAQESTILTLGADKQYSYEKVFDAPGKSQDEIFMAIKMWVVRNVKTQSNTNFFDEQKHTSISTTPAFTAAFSSVVSFKMNIDVKDGKYRLTANSFIWTNMQGIDKPLGDYSGISINKKGKEKVLKDVDNFFTEMITSIQKSVIGGGDGW